MIHHSSILSTPATGYQTVSQETSLAEWVDHSCVIRRNVRCSNLRCGGTVTIIGAPVSDVPTLVLLGLGLIVIAGYCVFRRSSNKKVLITSS